MIDSQHQSEDASERIARAAARAAIEDFCRQIGIDFQSMESLDDWHADRRFLRRTRLATEGAANKLMTSALLASVVFGVFLFFDGIADKIGGLRR